VAPEHFVKRLV